MLSFSVPSLTPLKAGPLGTNDAAEKLKAATNQLSSLDKSGTMTSGSLSSAGTANKPLTLNPGSTIYASMRPQSVKDQNLPAPLMECVENFKLDEFYSLFISLLYEILKIFFFIKDVIWKNREKSRMSTRRLVARNCNRTFNASDR
jgi:hypothetical protein